jgi:hypothetical protein
LLVYVKVLIGDDLCIFLHVVPVNIFLAGCLLGLYTLSLIPLLFIPRKVKCILRHNSPPPLSLGLALPLGSLFE